MNSWNQDPRNMDRKEDKPPYSRIFVVCSKHFQKEDLVGPFEKFGVIEDIYMPRDRNTGESKGVAYIKYSKTSEAATAIQELHLKCIDNGGKPIKVMVATNKNEVHSENEDRYKRLFIKVHREITENEVVDHFSKFGHVESVLLQRDKATQVRKGFGYVQYKTFLETAVAFEECDKKYKPVFATPKDELKRARYSLENENFKSSHSSIHNDIPFLQYNSSTKDGLQSLLKNPPQNYSTVSVTCSPHVSQKHIEALFNIVPGMLSCNYTINTYNGYCKASINYEDERAAAHAVDRLNNFEFPSGEIVSVKPDYNPLTKVAEDLTSIVNNFKNSVDSGHPNLFHLTAAIAQASSLIKAATSGQIEEFHAKHEIHDPNFCSVPLPSPKPIVSESKVAQRCFIVCKPHPPPTTVLKDVFSRFGDLIDVNTIPNKTFGFVKYASDRAAKEAIKTLNMATVCGIKLKVLLAEEKAEKVKMENDLSENVRDQDLEMDRKRMKLHD